MGNWKFNEEDEKVFAGLEEFIPDRVFDMHAHIYRLKDLNLENLGFLSEGPQEAAIDIWKEHIECQVGRNKLTGGLFFPYPVLQGNIEAQNNFIIEQVKARPQSKGLALVTPDTPKQKAREYLENKQIAGFKVYHLFSGCENNSQASINRFAPEWLWELADSFGAIIMLHLVKDGAIADTENRQQLVEMCSSYPNVKLILAHAGRGFHWYNTLNGLSALKGLENVWFDTSSICEPGALKAILKEFGPERLLWGSDFPISVLRGKCVTVGSGFVWLLKDMVNWDCSGCKPVLVGLEALRALQDAARDSGLVRKNLENIFYNNALTLI